MRRYWLQVIAALTAACSIAFTVAAQPKPAVLRIDEFQLTAVYPHDPKAFTQGLFYRDGFLYESTGLEGQSSIKKIDLKSGNVLLSVKLPPTLFGEGIVNWNNEIISVTWRNGIGFRWDISTLKERARFKFAGEGWGLTQDGTNLIMSDGTSAIRFLDPITLKERKRINVTLDGQPLNRLNELEWVKGKIFANVWRINAIVVIDPVSGVVQRVLDMTQLALASRRTNPDDVLNGIAYDAKTNRLWITGKNWPSVYELQPIKAK